MSSGAPNGPESTRARQPLQAAYFYVRRNLRSIAKAVVLLAIVCELAGIWNEVHHMRNEQVKNIAYAMTKSSKGDRMNRIIRRWESTAYVDGSVSIDGPVEVNGTVDVNQPVEVEIDR
jgi:hypothetical protein